jgi:flagellar biosynthesis chaperone FliJ
MNDLEIKSVVDEFGNIEAQIKALEAKRAELKSKINKLGRSVRLT